jgi:hypothetical protein
MIAALETFINGMVSRQNIHLVGLHIPLSPMNTLYIRAYYRIALSITVWHGTQEKYQRYDQISGRFNSEFGLTAFPQIKTIKYFTLDSSELHASSRTLDFHNKADGHERRIATYVAENFRLSGNLEVLRNHLFS